MASHHLVMRYRLVLEKHFPVFSPHQEGNEEDGRLSPTITLVSSIRTGLTQGSCYTTVEIRDGLKKIMNQPPTTSHELGWFVVYFVGGSGNWAFTKQNETLIFFHH